MSGDRDLLERATSALREASPPTQDELLSGRARLLEAHRAARKTSRARTLRWVLPLAAMLAAGSAFAAVPDQFERLAVAVTAMFAPEAAQTAVSKKKRVQPKTHRDVAPQQAVAPMQEPEPAPVPALSAEPAAAPSAGSREVTSAHDVSREGRRHRRAERARSAAPAADPHEATVVPDADSEPPAPTVDAPEPAVDVDLASYREAHRRHFRQRDFRSALLAWNTYLADFPRGTFAVEARYNRAICLVRLAQNVAAIEALRPFARGEVAHGYRQAEATKLLEALE